MRALYCFLKKEGIGKQCGRALLAGTWLLCLGTAAGGAAPAGSEEVLFLEIPTIVTASRRPETVQEALVTVEVITREEIEASGAPNLWDLLRFRAGMDVLDGRSTDGNRAIVSVRGFPEEFVDSLQVLLDGRSAYSTLSGGVYWGTLPVQTQEIERIEIVRGPNAALYGSNSGLGVINIITKKPSAQRAASLSALGGNFGRVRAAESFEESYRPFGYRFSHTYNGMGNLPAASGGEVNSSHYGNRANLRGYWKAGKERQLEFFAGGFSERTGVVGAGDPQDYNDQHFQMLRWEQSLPAGGAMEITASRLDDRAEIAPFGPGNLHASELRYDGEFLYRQGWLEGRAQTVGGASRRYFEMDSVELFSGNPRQVNRIGRGFLHQSLQINDLLSLAGSVSLEDSDLGGREAAYNAGFSFRPWRDHVFKISRSFAPTVPTAMDKLGNLRTSLTGQLLGNGALEPERITSHEIGYRGYHLKRRLESGANLFYTEIENLERFLILPQPAAGGRPASVIFTTDNGNAAAARGAEFFLRYRVRPGSAFHVNYTYESITDRAGVATVILGTPRHKLNLGGRMALGRGWSLSADAGYKDGYTLTGVGTQRTVAVPSYWRLDARIGYSPARRLELFFGAQNILEKRHLEYADGLEIPRTYSGGLRLAFGGRN